MNEKLENQLASTINKNLPRIAKSLYEISQSLAFHNHIMMHLAEEICSDEDEIITIHCITSEGIDRIISINLDSLVEDWENEAKLCPDNNAVIMSAKVEEHEFIGDELPLNANFQQLMEYFCDEDDDSDDSNEDEN